VHCAPEEMENPRKLNGNALTVEANCVRPQTDKEKLPQSRLRRAGPLGEGANGQPRGLSLRILRCIRFVEREILRLRSE